MALSFKSTELKKSNVTISVNPLPFCKKQKVTLTKATSKNYQYEKNINPAFATSYIFGLL